MWANTETGRSSARAGVFYDHVNSYVLKKFKNYENLRRHMRKNN